MENKLKIEKLCNTFDACERNYRVETCNTILQEFASTLVGRTFEEFIDTFNSGRHTPHMSDEQIKTFDVELNKICHVNTRSLYIPSTFVGSTVGRKQLVLHSAMTCLSFFPINDAFRWLKGYMFIENIRVLNVPALLDIMWNCTLFSDVHEHIKMIVDAYLECDSSESGFNSLTNKLKASMKELIDKIDDKLLPDKARFLQQLTNMGEKLDRNSIQDNETQTNCSVDAKDVSVSSVVNDFLNPRFINWIKGTLTLKYVNEGARYFNELKFQTFQREILPERGSHFDNGEYIKRMCEEVKCSSGEWKYPVYKVHCDHCEALFTNVIQLHNRLNDNAGFHNCKDIPVGGPWGIAKLFMPRNCKNVRTPDDLDTQALFHLILNCKLFSQCSYDNIDKIIVTRNRMMHSRDFTMVDDQLEELCVSELAFLEEAINLLRNEDEYVRQKLVSAKENIANVRELEITIGIFIQLETKATKFQYEDLKKVRDREDNEDNQKTLEKKMQWLWNKHKCNRNVERSHSLSMQLRNVVVDKSMNIIQGLRKDVSALEERNRELVKKKQMYEKSVMYHS